MTAKKIALVAATGTIVSFTFLNTGSAKAIDLVTNSTLGYYNNQIGDLYPGDRSNPLAAYFPGPNVSTGDPTNSFSTPPSLTGVSGLGSWLSDPETALTNENWSGLQSIPNTWLVNTETAVIYKVDGGQYGVENLIGNFGVDNGIYVWVNGVYKFGALASGGASPNEYSSINLGSLEAGVNYIQILREDHGGSTGYFVNIQGNYQVIPEPLTLLGVGTALGFGSLFKRQLSKKQK